MLYLPIAPPGSGKSYTAELMVKRKLIPQEAVVEPDWYRQVLTGSRSNQQANDLTFKIVDRIIDSRIEHDLDIYLDATNLNFKLRNRLLDRVTADNEFYHAKPLAITILVSDEPKWVVEERNRDREHPVPDHIFERMWASWEATDLDVIVSVYNVEDVMTFTQMEDRCLNTALRSLP